jgi:hypothetical protein
MSWSILLYERTQGACKPTVINLSVLSKGALSVLPSDGRILPYYEILESEVAKAAHKKTAPSSLFNHSFYYTAFITLKLLPFLRLTFLSEGERFVVTSPKNVRIM